MKINCPTGPLATFLLAAALACVPGPVLAAPASPQPISLPRLAAGKPVLSIPTPTGIRKFGLAELEAAGLREVTTKSFWPADDGTYQGPLLADVLKLAGIENAVAIRVTALDGFSQVIPRADWSHWPLLLATRRDGQPLSTRNKGPLRLIYPRDTDKKLEDTVYRLRWVWLVRSIEPSDGN